MGTGDISQYNDKFISHKFVWLVQKKTLTFLENDMTQYKEKK